MHVDIKTYQFGRLVLRHCAHDVLSMQVEMIGAVSFVRMLLVIAGIEQNPGPKDRYQYQYLLVEVGTKVVREIVDDKCDNDLGKYLDSTTHYKKLKALINGDKKGGKPKITAEQAEFLPPKDKHPKSSNFDIYSLICLLRYIYSERPEDRLWQNPAPSDMSLEANITRLRQCRSELKHGNTVWSEKEFDKNWEKLKQVLNRLYQLVKKTKQMDLSTEINDARDVTIDEELKIRHDAIVKDWCDMDTVVLESEMDSINEQMTALQEQVTALQEQGAASEEQVTALQKRMAALQENVATLQEQGAASQEQRAASQEQRAASQEQWAAFQEQVTALQEQVTALQERRAASQEQWAAFQEQLAALQENVATLQKPEAVETLKANIQQKLIESYQHDCSKLPLHPVFKDQDDDLLKIYQYPSMRSVDYHKKQSQDEQKVVTSYKGIFYEEAEQCQYVYMTGDAGTGKTSFCKRMCLAWCMAKRGNKSEKSSKISQNDLDCMNNFDFVFFVSLRETRCTHVIDMIIGQLFDTHSKDMYTRIETILREYQCLIILDGLDEWSPKTIDGVNSNIPKRLHLETCTYFTTCRPYIIESTRLSTKDIDKHVNIFGLEGKSSDRYVEHVVNYINEVNKESNEFHTFMKEVKECGLKDHLCIPILASNLVMVWFNKQSLTSMSRAVVYGYSLEMMFKRAEEKGIAAPDTLPSGFQFPKSLSQFTYIKKHASLIEKLCLFSFEALFKQNENVASLVFTKKPLESESLTLCWKDQTYLCEIGVLSKTKVVSSDLDQELTVSFIHKSYLEFFGALSLSRTDVFEEVVKTWTQPLDFMQNGNVILLLAGLCGKEVKGLFDNLSIILSDALILLRREFGRFIVGHMIDLGNLIYPLESLESLQNLVVDCYKEITKSIHTDKEITESSPTDKEITESSPTDIVLKLEHFNFNKSLHDTDTLKELLLLNRGCVKSIFCINTRGSFERSESFEPSETFERFGDLLAEIRFFEFPWRDFQQLTVLHLFNISYLSYEKLGELVEFLSGHVILESIQLKRLECNDNTKRYQACPLSLNLLNHSKLVDLCLDDVCFPCIGINNSSLQSAYIDKCNLDMSFDSFRSFIDSIEDKKFNLRINLKHCDIEVVDEVSDIVLNKEEAKKVVNKYTQGQNKRTLYIIEK